MAQRNTDKSDPAETVERPLLRPATLGHHPRYGRLSLSLLAVLMNASDVAAYQ